MKRSSYLTKWGTQNRWEWSIENWYYNLSDQNSNIHELLTFMDISLVQIILVCVFLVCLCSIFKNRLIGRSSPTAFDPKAEDYQSITFPYFLLFVIFLLFLFGQNYLSSLYGWTLRMLSFSLKKIIFNMLVGYSLVVTNRDSKHRNIQ